MSIKSFLAETRDGPLILGEGKQPTFQGLPVLGGLPSSPPQIEPPDTCVLSWPVFTHTHQSGNPSACPVS